MLHLMQIGMRWAALATGTAHMTTALRATTRAATPAASTAQPKARAKPSQPAIKAVPRTRRVQPA